MFEFLDILEVILLTVISTLCILVIWLVAREFVVLMGVIFIGIILWKKGLKG